MENQKVRYGRVFFISFMISAIICGSYIAYIYSKPRVVMDQLINREAQAQNSQFEAYFGEHVSSTEVKQLLSLIKSNNISSDANDEDKKIYVNSKDITDPNQVCGGIKSGSYYIVKVANDKATKPRASTNITEIANTEDGIADAPGGDAGYYDNGFIRNISITPVGKNELDNFYKTINSTVSNQSSYNNTIYSNSLNEVN